MDELTKDYLISYVTNQITSDEGNNIIKIFCEKQSRVSMIVYRGHNNVSEIRVNNLWYSATKSKKVAKEEFAANECCIFKINLVNIPIIDINKFIGNDIGEYKEEDEVIFLGGGVFYADKSLSTQGFRDLGNGEYECWYKIADKTNNMFDIDRYVKLLEEEYDMIDSPSDIFIDNITEDQKNLIFEKIKEIKSNMINGGKKRRKTKKSTKTKKHLKKNKKKSLKKYFKNKK